jgi:hypothetical protein
MLQPMSDDDLDVDRMIDIDPELRAAALATPDRVEIFTSGNGKGKAKRKGNGKGKYEGKGKGKRGKRWLKGKGTRHRFAMVDHRPVSSSGSGHSGGGCDGDGPDVSDDLHGDAVVDDAGYSGGDFHDGQHGEAVGNDDGCSGADLHDDQHGDAAIGNDDGDSGADSHDAATGSAFVQWAAERVYASRVNLQRKAPSTAYERFLRTLQGRARD